MEENDYDIGFSFDGDGDRVICCSHGKVIDGDLLIYIIARYLNIQNKLNKNKVVLSIMSNLGIEKALNKLGIEVINTPVGDKYIQQELERNELSLGGESSGHIILNNITNTGDGIFIALYILKILEETNTIIDDWINDIELYDCKMLNIKIDGNVDVINNEKVKNKINEIKSYLNNDCKIILRKSGTEPLIRLTIMAKKEANLYIDSLYQIIKDVMYGN
jgi:phosphoglucosamine mutase